MREKDDIAILVVEDEETVARILKIALGRAYTKVYFAKDGVEALKTVEEEKIDVVVCDLNMPTMNGFDLIEVMDGKHPEIKIVVASAYNYKEKDDCYEYDFLDENRYAKRTIQKSAVDAYFKKPFDLVELVKKIEELHQD